MTGSSRKRVLIVDDSAVVRQTLAAILSDHPGLEVSGAAADPFQAAEHIKRSVPDVVVLDVEMPRMDGITFLRRLMAQRPIPVVICSTLVGDGSDTFLAALDAGAVDIILKPDLSTRLRLEESRVAIQDVVHAAAHVDPSRWRPGGRGPGAGAAPRAGGTAGLVPAKARQSGGGAMLRTTERIVAIGASTGGTEALRIVLEAMPADAPPILIVQHMPEMFTRRFAERLDTLCAIDVKEAEAGDSVLPGRALIAPGARHMVLMRSGANYRVDLHDGPLVNRHRPSVDVLFRSVADRAGRNAVGVIMTGMGSDGADGLLEMRLAGAQTLGQDERTSTVYGMPAEAMRRGAVEAQCPLPEIAARVLSLVRERAA
jgi:two-component system chemotaxis response regulator CheB